MYDIIGDIHGHADELKELLELLGYHNGGTSWSHSTRKAIFVGDFIDRGPQIPEVLEIVQGMCEAGNALAVMGNHEFNALAYHTPCATRSDGYCRPHSAKNNKQHAATLEQLSPSELNDYLQWFRQLPMWLDLDGLRVVHACWDPGLIAVIEKAFEQFGGVTAEFLHRATETGTGLYMAVDDVLKGKETILPEGNSYLDKDGHPRSTLRVQWYREPIDETYASYALSADEGLPTLKLPDLKAGSVVPYRADAVPVFFGHYWLRADRPKKLATNVACVDYSVAKGGSLCAYRWDGERELEDPKFVTVEARS